LNLEESLFLSDISLEMRLPCLTCIARAQHSCASIKIAHLCPMQGSLSNGHNFSVMKITGLSPFIPGNRRFPCFPRFRKEAHLSFFGLSLCKQALCSTLVGHTHVYAQSRKKVCAPGTMLYSGTSWMTGTIEKTIIAAHMRYRSFIA